MSLSALEILRDIHNIEIRANETTSDEEKTTLCEAAKRLRLIIENVVITRDVRGRVVKEEWKIGGKLSRYDGPAFVEYGLLGNIKMAEWLIDGKRHRIGAPALITCNEYGVSDMEVFYVDGKWCL